MNIVRLLIYRKVRKAQKSTLSQLMLTHKMTWFSHIPCESLPVLLIHLHWLMRCLKAIKLD